MIVWLDRWFYPGGIAFVAGVVLALAVFSGCVTRTTVCVGVSHGLQRAAYDRAERDRADTSVCTEFERP